MNTLKTVTLRSSSDIKKEDLNVLEDYLKGHFGVVHNFWNRKIQINPLWAGASDCLVVVLPEIKFSKVVCELEKDLQEDIRYARKNKIPIFVAYRGKTSTCWRIYDTDSYALHDLDTIEGICGSTEDILFYCSKNQGLRYQDIARKLDSKTSEKAKTSILNGGQNITYEKSVVMELQKVGRLKRGKSKITKVLIKGRDQRLLLML